MTADGISDAIDISGIDVIRAYVSALAEPSKAPSDLRVACSE
jgi:hypothetical protein